MSKIRNFFNTKTKPDLPPTSDSMIPIAAGMVLSVFILLIIGIFKDNLLKNLLALIPISGVGLLTLWLSLIVIINHLRWRNNPDYIKEFYKKDTD